MRNAPWLALGLLAFGCAGPRPGGTGSTAGASTGSSASSSAGSTASGSASGSSGATTSSASSTGGTGSTGSSGSTGSTGSTGAVDAGAPDAGYDCAVEGVPGYCLDTSVCGATANHASTPGHCPGPTNIQCCTPYGLALCDPSVPRSPNAGRATEAPGQGSCPSGMIPIDTFCIDQFEASLVLDDGGAWSPYENPGTTPVRAVSVQGAIPQGYIDGLQAGDACTRAGKRLCTDTEWLRACQGPSGLTYPYGNTRQPGVCNDHRDEHPAVQYFGTTDPVIYTELDNACLDQLPMGLEPAGSLPGCVTAEGAYDMMGNLHEWTADPNGTFRGGYFVDTVVNGNGCLYATTAHNTAYWDYSTGFRCCAN